MKKSSWKTFRLFNCQRDLKWMTYKSISWEMFLVTIHLGKTSYKRKIDFLIISISSLGKKYTKRRIIKMRMEWTCNWQFSKFLTVKCSTTAMRMRTWTGNFKIFNAVFSWKTATILTATVTYNLFWRVKNVTITSVATADTVSKSHLKDHWSSCVTSSTWLFQKISRYS